MSVASTAGYGRNLLLFLMGDAVTAGIQGISQKHALGEAAVLFVFRCA
jgi:hypothetical protein